MKKILIAFVLLLLSAGIAQAVPFGFSEITANSPINVAAQLSVNVTQSGSNTWFTFTNVGPLQSSITDIYFDFGKPFPMTFNQFVSSAGVDFSVGAAPPNLPGGQTISFMSGWSADSNAPAVMANGINNGTTESLAVEFSGLDFATLIDSLNSGSFRVGVHVQGLSDGGSESYVSSGAPVPEPGTMALVGSGLFGLAVWGKRRMGRSD